MYWKLQNPPDGQPQPHQESKAKTTTKECTTSQENDKIADTAFPPTPRPSERPAITEQTFLEPEKPTIQAHATAGHAPSGNPNVVQDLPASEGGVKGPKASPLRKFHLTHETYPSLKRKPSLTNGIHKRQRPQKDRLAVFVESEKQEELIRRTIREHKGTSPNKTEHESTEDHENQSNAYSTIRKRPNVNAAEKAWRSETWGNQNAVPGEIEPEIKNQPATSWNAASMQMAQELQQIALDQSPAASEIPEATKPKFQPKPPPPRLPKVASGLAAYSNLDDDGDYIIDTYVRAPVKMHYMEVQPGSSFDPLTNIERGKIGILVIEENQEEAWEGFGDDEHSEPEFASDEEDENGGALPARPDA